jgi:hypothetical protein
MIRLLLYAIGVVIAFKTVSYIKNRNEKFGVGRKVAKIKKDKNYLLKLIASLDFFIKDYPIGLDINFQDRFGSITSGDKLGRFIFVYQESIDENNHLFITYYSKTYNFNTAIPFNILDDSATELNEFSNFDFIVKRNIERNKFEVYAGSHETLEQQNIQIDFSREMFECMRDGFTIERM